MNEYLLFAIIFIGLTVFFTLKTLLVKRSGWSGTVESVTRKGDSRLKPSDGDGGGYELKSIQLPLSGTIVIICRLDDGSRKKLKFQAFGIRRLFPDGIHQGDRLTKMAGSYDYKLDPKQARDK